MITIRVYDFLRHWKVPYGLTELPRGLYTMSFTRQVHHEVVEASSTHGLQKHAPWLPIACQWNINKPCIRTLVTLDAWRHFTVSTTNPISRSRFNLFEKPFHSSNNNAIDSFPFLPSFYPKQFNFKMIILSIFI